VNASRAVWESSKLSASPGYQLRPDTKLNILNSYSNTSVRCLPATKGRLSTTTREESCSFRSMAVNRLPRWARITGSVAPSGVLTPVTAAQGCNVN